MVSFRDNWGEEAGDPIWLFGKPWFSAGFSWAENVANEFLQAFDERLTALTIFLIQQTRTGKLADG